MTTEARMPDPARVAVDFNNVAGLGLIKASNRHGDLDMGQRILMYDGEGNQCEGTVVDERRIYHVQMDDATWRHGDA